MKTQKKLLMKIVFVPLFFIGLAGVGQFAKSGLPGAQNSARGDIRFLKGDAFSLTFEVHLGQIPAKGCQLRIADQTGEIIFEKRILSAEYRETYKVERGNLSKITFEATGRSFHFEESFNLRYRMEEKIEVTKL